MTTHSEAQPRPLHPITKGQPDEAVTVYAYQLRPDTWSSAAAWCGGTRILDADGNQALALGTLNAADIAHLGDFMVLRDTTYTVERADGFYQRFAPADAPELAVHSSR